ncbi:uncharacterized protein GLRG_11817 [Colletotrichum graminicola M1.001]|uniref:Uncharacterized protein n=1 Tax=Colletotrichum graminicola (strain M1.001 / M2 / FGSC 10212) TaxID=645133 RepID=E3R0N3_COLGM|nr:uncharacterized protein GLRG_11817 [Colletotrichum graminicola M1.001]EFQ36671.1 hypothetical protein GLRG_11817 [Colletotrichum graminicola M1.001]
MSKNELGITSAPARTSARAPLRDAQGQVPHRGRSSAPTPPAKENIADDLVDTTVQFLAKRAKTKYGKRQWCWFWFSAVYLLLLFAFVLC